MLSNWTSRISCSLSKLSNHSLHFLSIELVGSVGLEPTTVGLKDRCSACLSYEPYKKLVHAAGVEPAVIRLSAEALTVWTNVRCNETGPASGAREVSQHPPTVY